MIKKAFTIIELVFLILIVGLLAAVVVIRMNRANIYEMSEQVLAHIRYTQHMAMTQSVYTDQEERWFRARWQLRFINASKCGLLYYVGSDSDLDSSGSIEAIEAARDPLTRELVYNINTVCEERDDWYAGVLLGLQYNIISVSSSCDTQTIAFDHIGRPYMGTGGTSATDGLMKRDCHYTFVDSNGNRAKITVTAETGYAFITYI
jgi:type II secretory pathway pseudopilin PulG